MHPLSPTPLSSTDKLADPVTPYRLCFQPLIHHSPGFVFPCDSKGSVHLDELSEHARNNYFFARAMVGRALAPPAVEPASSAPDLIGTKPGPLRDDFSAGDAYATSMAVSH